MGLPQLQKIDFDACPDCGCTNIGGIRIGNGMGKHTCGEWREFIKFHCGSEYEYSPNYGKIICNEPCRKEGVVFIELDVTTRITVQVRKTTDLDKLDVKTLINVPGTDNYGCYPWQPRGAKWEVPGTVKRVRVLEIAEVEDEEE